jgi:arginase
MTDSSMVLFFPQYQAGYVPSHIPIGTPSLRAMWRNAPGFAEVPLQKTDDLLPETDRGIRFRRILRKQMEYATAIIKAAAPDFILTTGGDCGASFASLAYLNERYEGKVGVIWVDAHGDLHVPTSTPSENYHGMILRHLMGHLEFDLQPALPLSPNHVAYLGLRDTEEEEDAVIQDYGIPRFSAEEVMLSDGPLDGVLAHFKMHGLTHIHLHVDCDVMDEKVFPHVEVPEPGGLTLERLLEVLQYLRAQMPLSGCCLTEYAPRREGAGLDVIKRIYTEGLGLSLPA